MKNRHSHTTFRSLFADMTRWYGRTWLRDSLVLFACLVIVPVVIGSLV